MKILAITALIFITGCSTKTEYVPTYIYIKQDIKILSIEEQQKLEEVSLSVKDKQIIITEKEFKKLTSNIIIMKSYQEYLKQLVKYYESNIKKPTN